MSINHSSPSYDESIVGEYSILSQTVHVSANVYFNVVIRCTSAVQKVQWRLYPPQAQCHYAREKRELVESDIFTYKYGSVTRSRKYTDFTVKCRIHAVSTKHQNRQFAITFSAPSSCPLLIAPVTSEPITVWSRSNIAERHRMTKKLKKMGSINEESGNLSESSHHSFEKYPSVDCEKKSAPHSLTVSTPSPVLQNSKTSRFKRSLNSSKASSSFRIKTNSSVHNNSEKPSKTMNSSRIRIPDYLQTKTQSENVDDDDRIQKIQNLHKILSSQDFATRSNESSLKPFSPSTTKSLLNSKPMGQFERDLLICQIVTNQQQIIKLLNPQYQFGSDSESKDQQQPYYQGQNQLSSMQNMSNANEDQLHVITTTTTTTTSPYGQFQPRLKVEYTQPMFYSPRSEIFRVSQDFYPYQSLNTGGSTVSSNSHLSPPFQYSAKMPVPPKSNNWLNSNNPSNQRLQLVSTLFPSSYYDETTLED